MLRKLVMLRSWKLKTNSKKWRMRNKKLKMRGNMWKRKLADKQARVIKFEIQKILWIKMNKMKIKI